MDSLFYSVFGNMLEHIENNPNEEYFYTVKEIKDILHSRGGNVNTSRILEYVDRLHTYESNMKVHKASKAELDSFYKEALLDLRPILANLKRL